jgi:hypothetical protein
MTTAKPGPVMVSEQVRDGAPAPEEPPRPVRYVEHGLDDLQHRSAEPAAEAGPEKPAPSEPSAEEKRVEEVQRREDIDDESAGAQRPPSDS